MIFQTEMKGGNQKDSSDESRGTPFGARSSNRALLFAGNVRFPAEAAGEQHGKCGCRAGRIDTIRHDLQLELDVDRQSQPGQSDSVRRIIGRHWNTAQDSIGNQGSSAQTDTKIDNEADVLESLTNTAPQRAEAIAREYRERARG